MPRSPKAIEPPASSAARARPRRRLQPDERRELILSQATRFFAEHGFEALTRDLARRIGVSEALIYRYFPTKEDLIDKVYERVYLARWDPHWEALIADRSLSLGERLKTYYRSYLATFDNYTWIRISVYSGLRGNSLIHRYLGIIHDRIIVGIMRELRHDCGLAPIDALAMSKTDLELVWNLHGAVIYFLMRRYVFQIDPSNDNDTIADQAVDQMLDATKQMLVQRHAAASPRPRPHRPRPRPTTARSG